MEDKLYISDNQCFSEFETLNDGLFSGEGLVFLIKGNIVYYK